MTSEARCAKCFQALDPGARFCGKCGAEVQTVAEPASQPSESTVSGIECPSCHHVNAHSARFCETCGTQLQSVSGPGTGAEAGFSDLRAQGHAAGSEDPWATGPAYERQLRADEMCPRCGSHRNPDETVCASCGLPYGPTENYAGVPSTVATQGSPAGFWIRFVAAIVDGVVVNVVLVILALTLFRNIATTEGPDAVDQLGESFLLVQTINFLIFLGYHVGSLSFFGTTPGKKLFNIYILDGNANRKLSFGRALGRELSKYISTFILFIGYIMAGFRQDKRALHDLLAGTYPTVRHKVR